MIADKRALSIQASDDYYGRNALRHYEIIESYKVDKRVASETV